MGKGCYNTETTINALKIFKQHHYLVQRIGLLSTIFPFWNKQFHSMPPEDFLVIFQGVFTRFPTHHHKHGGDNYKVRHHLHSSLLSLHW